MFTSLLALKSFVLPVSLQARTDYDAALQLIGAGVYRQVEDHCNRRFARAIGDTYQTNGDRQIILLPRYPLEEVTLVEFQWRHGDGWTELADAIATVDEVSGLVILHGRQGDYRSQIRLTYTGGYWWDRSEDPEDPDAQPEDAEALPDHIRLAWLLQCKRAWEAIDKTGSSLSEKDYADRLATLDWAPAAAQMLAGERRQA